MARGEVKSHYHGTRAVERKLQRCEYFDGYIILFIDFRPLQTTRGDLPSNNRPTRLKYVLNRGRVVSHLRSVYNRKQWPQQRGDYRYMPKSFCRQGCPILPGSSMQKTVVLSPTLENVKGRYGVALEDRFNELQEPSLASSVL